jgi:hypothetical protein
MSWHKVTFKSEDCGIAGKGQRLHDAFSALLVASGGFPKDAALFCQRSADSNDVSYYFSPSTMLIAKHLIEHYRASPCPAPVRGTVDLAMGDESARDTLWPPIG